MACCGENRVKLTKILCGGKIHNSLTLNQLVDQGADKSLARPGRKQARKHARDARDFNNIETRAVIKVGFLQGKAPKEIHAILTETLACFLPGRAKDLSAPLYKRTVSIIKLLKCSSKTAIVCTAQIDIKLQICVAYL